MRLDHGVRGPLAAVSGEAAAAQGARGASPLKRQLHEEGYCCIPEFLSVDEIDALRSETRDCDLFSSTRTVFDRIGGLVVPGTVIIFDEFYRYFGWEEDEANAFLELVVAEKLEIEYLARTPTCQVSLRILGRGVAPRSSVRRCTWSPTGAGVGIRDPHESADEPGGPQGAAAAK